MSEPRATMNHDSEYRTIEERAAEWFGRCELGLSPEQEKEFMVWLEADARHGEAMREMDETWQFLDRLKEARRTDGAGRKQPGLVFPFGQFGGRRAALLAAAAASIAVCFFASRRPAEHALVIKPSATALAGM